MKNVMEKPRESRFLVNQVAGFLKNRGFSVRHYICDSYSRSIHAGCSLIWQQQNVLAMPA